MPRLKVWAWSGVVVAAAAVVVVAVYVVFWPLSDVIARHDVAGIIPQHRAAALQAARDAARGRLVAFGAGLFAVGALVFTARNFSLARQGQVTDRYTKAIEQLGSDKGLDVRIGGIYALERIARDSPRDHPTIMEVLAAFIGEHSREPWPPAEHDEPLDWTMRPDVQAAATVIGRRTVRYDSQPVNLGFADLTRAQFYRADLTNVDLTGANLSHAHLHHANLTGADLSQANLNHAYLDGANLDRSKLYGADLNGAHLDGANLTGADLTHAILKSANLIGANLNHAALTDANLNQANLVGANLTGAFLKSAFLTGANLINASLTGANLTDVAWPASTPIPRGWRQDSASGRLTQAVGDAAAE